MENSLMTPEWVRVLTTLEMRDRDWIQLKQKPFFEQESLKAALLVMPDTGLSFWAPKAAIACDMNDNVYLKGWKYSEVFRDGK